MLYAFRFVYLCAALLAAAAGLLVIASLFIEDRAPSTYEFLGISLAVSAFFLGMGLVLFGVQRHVTGIADIARLHDGGIARQLATRVDRLVAHLLTGGVLLVAVLAVITYAILARIDQGFAVFG
jgi:hypothetical protein